jgi:hypothetical protein
MTITSPSSSTRLRFPPRGELDSTSSDKSMTASVECTSLRLFDPRVGRDVASAPSSVKSMPIVWGSGVPFASVGCVFARPFPLAEKASVFADASVLFVDVGVEEVMEEMEGEGGGGGGLAYSSVHCRAIRSCMGRLRMNSVAIDGTG